MKYINNILFEKTQILTLCLIISKSLYLHSQCNFQSIDCGLRHTIAIAHDGTLWAWGSNNYGELGTGDFQDYNRPVLVNSDTNWFMVSATGEFSLALKRDGSIWSTGLNYSGQLGIGSDRTKGTFTKVSGNTKFKYISTSEHGSIAVAEDGSLFAWGYLPRNFTGRNSDSIHRPLKLNLSNDWEKIEASPDQTANFIGLKRDGSVWSWGRNTNYKLGIGLIKVDSLINTPTRIPLNSNIMKIQNGPTSCLALSVDGSLWSWGDNLNGELGNNEYYEPNLTPKLVGKVNEWKDCATGVYMSTSGGVKKDGTLWLWGDGGASLFNDPLKKRSNIPEQIGVQTNWTKCFLGWQVSFAIDQNSNLYAWGESIRGKLGLGLMQNVKKPTNLCCPTIQSNLDSTVCDLDTFVLNGKKYYPGKSNGTDSLISIQGCDSIVLIKIKFTSRDSTQYFDTACYNDKIIINGISITRDDPTATISLKKQGKVFCDSIVSIIFHFTDSLYVADSIYSENNEFKINITPIGGTSPYRFSWSTGDSLSIISINNKDTYHLTVTDHRGCTFFKSYFFGISADSYDPIKPINFYIKENYLVVDSEFDILQMDLYSLMGERHYSQYLIDKRVYLGEPKNSIWICRITTVDEKIKKIKFFH